MTNKQPEALRLADEFDATKSYLGSKAAAELRRLHEVNAELVEALKAINSECFSHVDGRDLFAQMHPRNMLDIKRRVDGQETWFEGDWLSNLWEAIKKSRVTLAKATGENND